MPAAAVTAAAAQAPASAPAQYRPVVRDLRQSMVRSLAQFALYCDARYRPESGIDGVGVLVGLGDQIGSAEGVVDSRFPRNLKRSLGGWPLKIGSGVKDVFKLNSQDWDLEFPRGPSPSTMSRHNRETSPGWREFLKRHDLNIWARDFFCVRTIQTQSNPFSTDS